MPDAAPPLCLQQSAPHAQVRAGTALSIHQHYSKKEGFICQDDPHLLVFTALF